MENMAAIVRPQATEALRLVCSDRPPYCSIACTARIPLPEVDDIYKSRVAGMWIDHRGLAAAINRVNAQAQPPPPALP